MKFGYPVNTPGLLLRITVPSPSMSSRSNHTDSSGDDGGGYRDRDSSEGWETAGAKKQSKKRERQQKKERDQEEAESSKRSNRKQNKEGGNAKERRDIRTNKVKEGYTNVTSTSSGPRLGPLFKPPTLSTRGKGKTPAPPSTNQVLTSGTESGPAPANTTSSRTLHDKQNEVKATYARMASSNSGKPYEIRVLKKDRGAFTREDQWQIQFGISHSLLEATKAGKKGEEIAHGGTRLNHRALSVFCGPMAGPYYKQAINKLAGYEAFLLEKHVPGREIYTILPGYAHAITSRLHEHFAAGTFGEVKPDQVKISRKAWRAPGDTGSFHVYLEIDEDAFNWLKARDWISPIGLFVARWAHPPVQGISGYIRPDQDIKKLKQSLQAGGTSAQETEQADHTLVPVEPMVTENIEEQNALRSRHITGEEKEEQDAKAARPKPTNNVFHEDFTPEEVAQLLNEVPAPKDRSTPGQTATPRSSRSRSREHSSPGKRGKHHRRENSKGDPISDPSDNEDV